MKRFSIVPCAIAVLLSLSMALAMGCVGSTQLAPSASNPADGSAKTRAPLAGVIRVFHAQSGQEMTLDAMIERLAGFDAVFLGETHLDEITHRVELAVYERMLASTGNKVVLAMEMFSRADQSALDRYLAKSIDEAGFLAEVKEWGNYRTGYRPMVERARQGGLPVVGSNVPRSVTRAVAMGGQSAYESLSTADKALVAPELLPASEVYWQRVARAVRGHAGPGMYSDPDKLLYSVQSLWDNTMAHSCAEAMARHPGYTLLHVNGSFHSNRRLGTVEQLRLRRPNASIATVSIMPSHDLASVEPALDAELADFLIYTETRARGVTQGAHAVYVSRELKYRLHVPDVASAGNPAPLLIWLAREGSLVTDIARYWKLAMGRRAAVAVVEMPHRQTEDQLHVGGRWFFDDSFGEDMAILRAGLERLQTYVSDYYPVDKSRIVIAGRGAGATAAAAAALYAGESRFDALAFAPERYAKLRSSALPDRSPKASLLVWTGPAGRDFWYREARDYAGAGLQMTVVEQPGTSDHFAMAKRVRSALGLAGAVPWSRGALSAERPTPGPSASVIQRSWIELYEMAAAVGGVGAKAPSESAKASSESVVSLATSAREGEPLGPARFADGKALPLAPGPFGGTTLVVVGGGVSAKEREAWIALEKANPVKARSRFSRVQVAFLDGGPSLPEALDRIRNAGRSNVLIVPAVFCASADDMRALRAAAGSLDGLTVAWLPGLGGGLYAERSSP